MAKTSIVMDQKSAALDDPGGRILLIEDNATLRQGLQVVLESWGYDVLTAVNGEEALDIAARLDWEVRCDSCRLSAWAGSYRHRDRARNRAPDRQVDPNVGADGRHRQGTHRRDPRQRLCNTA
jgi:hypothetical protein